MSSYFSSGLMAQVQLGIETTYLITSSIRCVCAYVSIFTHLLSSIKAAQEPKLLLASSIEMSLLSSLTNMGPLEAPTSLYSVICLDHEHLALLGAHYIYRIQTPHFRT